MASSVLRDDPFVFDFAQFTRITQATPTQDTFRAIGTSFRGRPVRTDGTSGVDSFAGFNVTSIAVSVPKTSLRGSTSKINVWATVSSRVPTRHGSKTYQQFERQGQQAFATLFVGTGTVNSATGATTSAGVTAAARGAARDAFNFAIPENDSGRLCQPPPRRPHHDGHGRHKTTPSQAGPEPSLLSD